MLPFRTPPPPLMQEKKKLLFRTSGDPSDWNKIQESPSSSQTYFMSLLLHHIFHDSHVLSIFFAFDFDSFRQIWQNGGVLL